MFHPLNKILSLHEGVLALLARVGGRGGGGGGGGIYGDMSCVSALEFSHLKLAVGELRHLRRRRW